MAKKQSLSYGPNMGLIAGEAAVAGSEAGLTNVGGAFAQGFTNVFAAYQKEEEERAAKMEAYAAQFPGLEQSNFMANATNKQIVTDFLNTQRDKYVKLAETYEKTKDRKVLDQMNAIKFSITNLDDQIKVFNQDKGEYRTAFHEDQLADGQVYDKDFYTNIFTNNAKFSITENGDISFDITGKKNKSNLYKDHAGNWTNRNNISESSFLKMYSKAQATGEKGDAFYRDTTYRALLSNLKATGNEGLQTFVTTDLTGDKSDFTFQQQWASGSLDDKFYKIRGKAKQENDTSWMFDNKNAGELRKLVADYYTDVVESGYKTGKKNYKDPNNNKNINTKVEARLGWNYDGNTSSFDPDHPDESLRSRFNDLTSSDLIRNRNSLIQRTDFAGNFYYYKFNKDKNTWQAFYNNKLEKDVEGNKIAEWEGLLSPNDMRANKSTSMFDVENTVDFTKNQKRQEEEAPTIPGTVGLGSLIGRNKDDSFAKSEGLRFKNIKNNLLSIFTDDFDKKFDIIKAYKSSFTTGGVVGAGSTSSVDGNKIIIRSKDGSFEKEYSVGNNATREIAEQISNDFKKYITPIDPNLLIKN